MLRESAGVKNKLDYDHIDMDDLKMLMDIIDKTMEWLDTNQDGSKGEYRKKYAEMDSFLQPVFWHLYEASTGGGGNNNDVGFDKSSLKKN